MDSVKVKNEFISLLAESNKKASALGRGPCWGSFLLFQLWRLSTGKGEKTGGQQKIGGNSEATYLPQGAAVSGTNTITLPFQDPMETEGTM